MDKNRGKAGKRDIFIIYREIHYSFLPFKTETYLNIM